MNKIVIFEYEHWVILESVPMDIAPRAGEVLRWSSEPYTLESSDGGVLCVPPKEIKVGDESIAICCSKCGEIMSKKACNMLSSFLKLMRTSR